MSDYFFFFWDLNFSCIFNAINRPTAKTSDTNPSTFLKIGFFTSVSQSMTSLPINPSLSYIKKPMPK